jgi:ribosomal protein S18 acetylase RimI-like enzyme
VRDVLSPAEQSERAARGLHHVWRAQCGYVAGGEVAERDGVLVTATRLPDETLSCAFLTSPPPDVDAALDWCAAWFRERGLRMGIELRVGAHPVVETSLSRRGFGVVVRRPSMTLHPLAADGIPTPHRVTIRAVAGEADLVAAQAIQGEAFAMTPEVAAAFLPPAMLDSPGLTLYVAAYDDVPCATAAVSVSEHGAGIVGVATLRAYRRRGIARAVTATAVEHGRQNGADLAWLYPTAMAQELYAGLGFATLDDVQVWVEPR